MNFLSNNRISLSLLTTCTLSLMSAYGRISHDIPVIMTKSPFYTFDTGFTALVVKPMAHNMHYAAEVFPVPYASPHWSIYDVQPTYTFGFELELAMHFKTLDTSLRTHWQRVHTSNTNTLAVSSGNTAGPFFEIGPDAGPYTKVRGNACFSFDEVNLVYGGEQLDFCDRLESTVFAGISFAHIKQVLSSTYSNTDSTIARTIQRPISFNGAGPQIGIDFAYDIAYGLHFTGKSVASLLVGSLKNHTTFSSISPALADVNATSPNTQSISTCSRTQIVPAFNQRLGLAYMREFYNHYLVKIEAGYQAQIYLDALQSVDIGSEVVTPPVTPDTVGVFARTFQRTLSNFALAGAYISLNIGF